LDLMMLIGGAEEWAAIQLEMSPWSRKRGDEKFLVWLWALAINKKCILWTQATEIKLLCSVAGYTLMEFRRMGYRKGTKHIYPERKNNWI
jgi:hypothetical protein